MERSGTTTQRSGSLRTTTPAGFVAEAEEQEELIAKLRVLIPELLERNDEAFGRLCTIDVHLHFSRQERISLTVAA